MTLMMDLQQRSTFLLVYLTNILLLSGKCMHGSGLNLKSKFLLATPVGFHCLTQGRTQGGAQGARAPPSDRRKQIIFN